MNNKELIERARRLRRFGSSSLLRELVAALEQADAENAELAARLEVARACAERAKLIPEWDRMPHAIHVELDALFKTLTSGNAVKKENQCGKSC